MIPVGSIWRWETDGSVGMALSEPYTVERSYGQVEVIKFYFFDAETGFMEVMRLMLNNMVRSKTIRRLDNGDSDE